MLKEYPKFKYGDLTGFYKNELSEKERDIFEKFLEYCSITAASRKIDDVKRNITNFRVVIGVVFDEIDLESLRRYLSLLNRSDKTRHTKNDIKNTIKRFLRWKFKDWSERFDDFKDIKLQNPFNEERINHNTLVKKGEIEKIMKAEGRLFWKAFFISLYETGLRPIELRNLKWRDINFNVDGDISEINIYATKTSRARAVYVKEATYYLNRLKEEKEVESDLVFPSPNNPNKTLTKQAVSQWTKELSIRAIKRQIFPYLLRHTRATELYKNANIPDKIAQKFMGHSKNMSDFYTHLSSDDVKEAMGKSVYKLEDLPEDKKHELELEVESLKEKLDNVMKHLDHLEQATVLVK